MIRYHVSDAFLGRREIQYLAAVIDSGRITQGAWVRRFEELLENYLGVKHAVACSSGTAALHLALAAVNIGPEHAVQVPDMSFVATANAVKYTGAEPWLCDIDPLHWDINPDRDDAADALIAVHLYGEPANVDRHLGYCTSRGIPFIEDAAQGFGVKYRGKYLGTHGDMGTFSFYGNKILTTGEGGAVVTNQNALAERLRHLRGQAMTEQRYFHDEVGFNYRMTEMQAAIGVAQFERLDTTLAQRHAIFELYQSLLSSYFMTSSAHAAPWLFTVVLPDRVSRACVMRRLLEDHGIETRPAFVPMHRLPAFSARVIKDTSFPVSSHLGDHALNLPTHVNLTKADVQHIAYTLLEVVSGC